MKKLTLFQRIMMAVLLFLVTALAGCSGGDGAAGPAGTPGTPGSGGTAGEPGGAGVAVLVAERHGGSVLAATELATASKYMVNITITSATADESGVGKVNFTVQDSSNAPVTTIASVSAGIFKLAPKTATVNYNKWVPYLWRTEAVAGTRDAAGNAFVKPDGTIVNQGYRESSGTGATNGTLLNNGGGSYTYTFKKNLAAAARPDGTAIAYERNLTHRVSIYTGGHNGPTGEGDFDFIPDGSPVTQTRNIVKTATCKNCHGPEFAGHGGDRVTVEGCVTCHSPDSYDAQSGESIEMAVMIHKIHAGGELATVAGPNRQFWDNPHTAVDETADNGKYILWGNGVRAVSWEKTAFPAVIANCEACHTGTGLQDVDNWKSVPSRAACGSCHDDINWTTGANHAGGAFSNDNICSACHQPATGISPVTKTHQWTTKDIRNIPEFDITITTDTPARGYYVNGEKPVVTIVLKNKATGVTIDHTTVVQDPTAEGCVPVAGSESTACTVPSDGLFTAANVYVTGPRAQRVPVLTYPARAKVTSASAGPWDLSAGGGALRLKVDSSMPMLTYNNAPAYEGYGADEKIAGDFTVTLPAAGAALNALFANPAAATPAEVAAWLNANGTFKERAVAYVDESPSTLTVGRLSIRSRGIQEKNAKGDVIKTTAQRNIQIVSSPAGMFTDLAIKTAGAAASARKMTVVANTDPKVAFSTGNIKYTLDPVDDLVAGTYMINVEFADRGRGPGNPPEPPFVDYRTPSITVATFQVKQSATEKPIADGCTACHWSSGGVGFVLDYPRHNKPFNAQALDQCGGCHDYASGMKSDATTAASWSGGLAIAKRVHAVHNGANLNYPTITVGHEETATFGRNWRITYPMNIRNCESCHPATTSGTWMTNPNRLACLGCHDSDAAVAHINIQTYDPTPLAPWSGDEKESCKACH